ncbi:MAG: hypothetical protein JXB38_09520 [Anaerolineales bacterium]|nr:hypothetical protein [Anaerolineales bacterium]
MKTRWLLLTLLFLFLLPHPVQAQEDIQINSLRISLWPEYDRPEMLVIYQARLADTVTLPAQVSLSIPTVAGQPHAVAVGDPNGALVNAEYQLQVEGIWTTVTLETDSPFIQMEYYDPGLQRQGDTRSFQFLAVCQYPVDALELEVQQPFDAENLTVSPSLGQAEQGPDGLWYYDAMFDDLSAGDTFALSLSYIKPSTTLTLAALQSATPATAEQQPEQPAVSFRKVLPWVGGGIIFLAAALIALGYWRARSQALNPQSVGTAMPAKSGGVFCQNCGERAAAGARFCQVCGVELQPHTEEDQAEEGELEILSKREKEVLTLVAQGMTSPEIGEKLGISPKTVSRHRERIMKKLGTSNVADLVKFAIRTGLVELE